MALETILGGILGGVTRLAPEVLGFFDKKNERKHELQMASHELEVAKLQQEGQFRLKDREIEGAQFTSALSAIQSGIEAQGKPTGIRWVDAVSALIRPGVTIWLFVLYAIYKIASLDLAVSSDVGLAESIKAMWTQDDSAMLSAVLTFWFIGRVWERESNRSFK